MRRVPLALLILLCSAVPESRAGLPSEPVELWRWNGQDHDPLRPWPNMVIAVPLTDRDGDGDADRDDGPDVAFVHSDAAFGRDRQTLTAVDGRTGEVLFDVSSPMFGSGSVDDPTGALAAADTDGDGFVELFSVSRETSFPEMVPPQLLAFEHDGTLAWSRPWPGSINYSGQALGLADMNQDGVVEATIVGNVLSVDGSLSWSISETLPGTRGYACFSLAADVDPAVPGLELVYGGHLYSATGDLLWGDFFAPMGAPAVGDFDGDGGAEVVIVERQRLYRHDHLGNELQAPLTTPGSPPNGARPSAPAVADLDGDGLDDLVVACNEFLVAYGFDGTALVERWAVPINDWSGICGPSAFDFDGDGASEVVYRDQDYWYIFEGADGAELHRQFFPSRTGNETPIIFGMPGGCGAVVVVTGFGDIPSDDALAHDAVVAYEIAGGQSPRAIWNQRTYHGTNVTEDGQVPLVEEAPWIAGHGWTAQTGSPSAGGSLGLGPVAIEDLSDCQVGLLLTWEPATSDEPGTPVVHDVYRSDDAGGSTCADAVARPAIATDLTEGSWLDTDTVPGGRYAYVVRARVPGGGACIAPVDSCAGPVTEGAEEVPDGVYATLRARHDGDRLTLTWEAARELLPDETFRLLKASGDANQAFGTVPGVDGVTRSYSEIDVGARVQFFDLRVASPCGRISQDEFPPGY